MAKSSHSLRRLKLHFSTLAMLEVVADMRTHDAMRVLPVRQLMDWRRNHFPIDHCFTAGESLPLRHNYGLKTFDLDQLRKALMNHHITAHLKKWLRFFKDSDRGPFAKITCRMTVRIANRRQAAVL